jgi:alpha amylase-like protein
MPVAERIMSGTTSDSDYSSRLRWPRFPTTYEVNTWVWLDDLSRRLNRHVELSSVPPAEWDAFEMGFDSVWLMGVWERSPAGIAIANQNSGLVEDFRQALSDYSVVDNVGSPYCVRRYVVDAHLGGSEGLACARRELAKRGMKLMLDFVPNHVAPDHAWAREHPEYFIRGNEDALAKDPGSWMVVDGNVFACGRDPFFPAWPDVLQLNAFEPELRRAAIRTVENVAEQCDGIRCDMAMLLLNSVFDRTWGHRAGKGPRSEYWQEVISKTKARFNNFIFVAEAYWNLEWELHEQGFDFCYDKQLYDRLEHSDADSVRLHLCAERSYQDKLVRFIENHDEPRAAATFSSRKEQATAVTVSTVPGMRLFHQGQFEGRRVRSPVFLGRWPDETADGVMVEFYRNLLVATRSSVFRDGEWTLCERSGWPDNQSFRNLVAWYWKKDDERFLVAVNLSDSDVQGLVQVPWSLTGECELKDVMTGLSYVRDAATIRSPGLYVELGSWAFHFFRCTS